MFHPWQWEALIVGGAGILFAVGLVAKILPYVFGIILIVIIVNIIKYIIRKRKEIAERDAYEAEHPAVREARLNKRTERVTRYILYVFILLIIGTLIASAILQRIN